MEDTKLEQIGSVLVDRKTISKMLVNLSDRINRDYVGREILMVGVLKGALVFMADLMRLIKAPVLMDFIVVSSYGVDTETSGVVMLIKDIDVDIRDRHVILVEDLIDTGFTLKYLTNLLKGRNPASLKICVAFDKPERRKVDIEADYVGIQIPDKFVVGYGLDIAGMYRNLPDLHVLRED